MINPKAKKEKSELNKVTFSLIRLGILPRLEQKRPHILDLQKSKPFIFPSKPIKIRNEFPWIIN